VGSNTTLVVTSCDRWELLKETLDSLIECNCGGIKPDATIIIEGSGREDKPKWYTSNWPYYESNLGKITWISNVGRKGQIYSIDKAYSQVKTDYIMHWEDDWKTIKGGDWMQRSRAILDKYPSIIQVSLRGNTGWHQLIDQPPYEGFKIAMPYWHGGWGGLAFNPGLRRTSDYRKIGSYGRHTTCGITGLGHEKALSKMLLDQGYRIADLNEIIVVHTGGSCSRANEPLDPQPKILIAIPACHRYEYGAFESGDSPLYNQAAAHEGHPYGTGIHLSGTNDRIATLRDTWLKDVAKFPDVTYKFFYGEGGSRPAQDDEVYLPVPDDYRHLPHKTIAICKYALANNYDLLFKCDDDTGVYVDRLVHEALSGMWDYAGYPNGRVASGGPGYWLSREAFKTVAEHASNNYHWAEDVTVSQCMFHHNIQLFALNDHKCGRADHWFFPHGFDPTHDMNNVVTFHAVQPEVMRAWYANLTDLRKVK
jgi:hypothetical protein